MHCRACGDAHDATVRICPRANGPVSEGPCGGTLDRYDVDRLLGVGGFGAVYRARHTHLRTQVALKLLRTDGGFSTERRASLESRFFREARAAASIDSPHVVRVQDFGVTSEGTAFLAMELLDGRDLGCLLEERGSLSAKEAADIGLGVLSGLEAAHAAGIVHRDLKPANVFLVPKGSASGSSGSGCFTADSGHGASGGLGVVVKLLDFGIARAVRPGPTDPSLTREGMVLGTPAYMAPEQLLGRPADTRSDLYSAGVVLYQMLSGRLPHEASTFEQLVVSIATQPGRPLRAVCPNATHGLAEVVDRALSRVADDRFQSATEMRAALQAAAQPLSPMSVRPVGLDATLAVTRLETGPVAAARGNALLRSAARGVSTEDGPAPSHEVRALAPASTGGGTGATIELASAGGGNAPGFGAPQSVVPTPQSIPARVAHRRLPTVALAAVAVVGGGCLATSGLLGALALRGEDERGAQLVPVAVPAPLVADPRRTAAAEQASAPWREPDAADRSPRSPTAAPDAQGPDRAGLAAGRRDGQHGASLAALDVDWQVLGTRLSPHAVAQVVDRARPAIDACRRPGVDAHAAVQLFVQGAGVVTRGQPSAAEPNDPVASRCVARALQTEAEGLSLAAAGAGSVSDPAGGIVTVRVTLPALGAQ